MRNKLRFENTAFWIGFLLVLLVLLNVIAFIIYKQANPATDIWVQLWNYLESTIFKIIAASLILPLILFVLESRFKILDTVNQNRVMRERKQEEELSEKRWECIEETSKILNRVWNLIHEVVYFKEDADKGKTIEDLLIKLRNQTTTTEDVFNMWSHRFPNLPAKYSMAFSTFYNTELNSAETVAWCIRQGNNEKEIDKLQDSLKRIAESINYLTHHSLIDVLKYSMELLELKEAKASSNKQKNIKKKINKYMKSLNNLDIAIRHEHYKNNRLFSLVDTDDVEDYRKAYQKLVDWLRKNPDKDPASAEEYKEEYDNLRKLFYKIPHEQAGPNFSREFVMYLANWLSLEYQRVRLLRWRIRGQ